MRPPIIPLATAALVATFVPDAGFAAQDGQAITTIVLRPGISVLHSPPDGNILVVRGTTATLIVDALAPGLAVRADSAIRATAGGVPDWVINTHYHADHIGANGLLRAAGATTVGQANLPMLAARDTTIAELQWDLNPADAANVPAKLVADSLRIELGGEQADLLHAPRAHTGGDLIVRLARANIIHTGDIVEFGGYPFIDWWAGGSYDGLLAAVDRIIAHSDDRTVLVPGHGQPASRNDVVEYRRMLDEVGARVRQGILAGLSADSLVAERLTAAWDAKHGGERGGNRFVRLLHLEFTQAGGRAGLTGTVRTRDGAAAAGALVRVQPASVPYTHTVIADALGRYRMDGLPPGEATVSAGFGGPWGEERAVTIGSGDASVDLAAGPLTASRADLPASSLLSLLPADDERSRFIRDCTGCHVFDARTAYPGGTARTHADWSEAVTRMLGMSGPRSTFPVIAEGREAQATADYLTSFVTASAQPAPPAIASPGAAGALITEYAIPEAGDLPHDVAVTADGQVLVTGMFTHRMYVLDPATGEFELVPIPVGNANPRAVEVGADGAWWLVLGSPRTIARRDPGLGTWATWNVGTYPHSLAIAPDGRVWYNGHFSRNPEILGFIDPANDAPVALEVPAHPEADVGAGPIPYELRTGPDGRIWGSELTGDRIFAYDPATERFRTWMMPGTAAGPRRLDIAPDGIVWIPEYSGGHLTKLDPATGRFTRYPVPVDAASPYVARVDARTGRVWLGTGAADAIFAFDPATDAWTTYPLPSRATLVRHLAIDPRNGDLWIAYGASPGPPAKVARLRLPQ